MISPPGKTIGIFGGGQLGRMAAIEARKMGYRVHVYDPASEPPAAQGADLAVQAPFDDLDQLRKFLEPIDVATFEFENIPADFLHQAAAVRPVHPSPEVLLICQNREREKRFLSEKGFPVAPYAVVTSAEELDEALNNRIGRPAVLKTAAFGYDGKGQVKIGDGDDARAVWEDFGNPRGVLEAWVPFTAELSAICAVSANGETAVFPVAENQHERHILDVSIAPARLDAPVQEEAARIAKEIARALGVIGLVAVEFFLTGDGRLLVNELAPRPHNSGHYTFDGCMTSQFEQQVRAVCGLPLGSTALLAPTVMVNLLGDLWRNGEPDWNQVLQNPNAKLHLYGKREARPGRKMGHFCVLGPTVEEALAQAQAIQSRLQPGSK